VGDEREGVSFSLVEQFLVTQSDSQFEIYLAAEMKGTSSYQVSLMN